MSDLLAWVSFLLQLWDMRGPSKAWAHSERTSAVGIECDLGFFRGRWHSERHDTTRD
jgi:hypothetical protein